jgi:hypothetical protein
MRFIEKLHRKNSIKDTFDNESIVIVLSEPTEKKGQSIKGTLLNKSVFLDNRHIPLIKSGCQLLVVKQKDVDKLSSTIKGAVIVKWGSKMYTHETLGKLKGLNSHKLILSGVQSISNNLKQINQLIPKYAVDLCAISNNMAKDLEI